MILKLEVAGNPLVATGGVDPSLGFLSSPVCLLRECGCPVYRVHNLPLQNGITKMFASIIVLYAIKIAALRQFEISIYALLRRKVVLFGKDTSFRGIAQVQNRVGF